MSWDHHGPAFLAVYGDDHVHDLLQRIDGALNTAASGQIDDRIVRGGENIAGADDIGTAKEHDAVTVGMGRGLMQNVDSLAVEVQLLLIAQKGAGGPTAVGRGWFFAGGCAHAVQDVYVGKDGSANAGVFNIAGDIGAHDGTSGQANFLVPTSVIGMVMRVDD